MGNIKENLTEQTAAQRNETSFSIMKWKFILSCLQTAVWMLFRLSSFLNSKSTGGFVDTVPTGALTHRIAETKQPSDCLQDITTTQKNLQNLN